MSEVKSDGSDASGTEPALTAVEPAYSLSYWTDRSEVIVRIAGGWDAFARDNEAPTLTASRTVGRNLMDFVAGDVTRMYLRTLMHSVHLQRQPLVRTYRCDSPLVRREMEMRLSMTEDGLLRWDHGLRRAEPLDRPVPLSGWIEGAGSGFHVRCSICNRLKSRSGWDEPDALPAPRSDADGAVRVIHGVCPDCLRSRPRP